MEQYQSLSKEQLLGLCEDLKAQYEGYKAQNLKLDMSRGKPSPEQLDLTMGMLDILHKGSGMVSGGVDTRNYGMMDGLPEAKKIFADILEVEPGMIIIGGTSSLNMMYDTVVRALLLGVYGGKEPWIRQGKLKFLCPVPGYDRHFAITEQLGIEMVGIPMDENGPDMDLVEQYVNSDPSVKGIWCVPTYSNPGGIVYSDAVVRRFAALRPAADDFRIFWDNAYVVHDLYPERAPKLYNLFEACKEYGSEDMVFEFCSTSKVSFSGGGICAMAASERNIELIKKQMSVQVICFDKVNQLQHVRFFKDKDGVLQHMKRHAAVIRPKFELVLGILREELGGLGIASWTDPAGGYFISVDTLPGCAKRTVQLCKEAGVVLTGAGAAFPYGKDPQDQNIRLAPTYPELRELEVAARLFTLCLKLAAAERLLAD